MNKIIQEIKFITFMKSCKISKRQQKENKELCDEFPSFLYDMINDRIDDIYIYEFIYVNYKRPNFYKQLYYHEPSKTYWETPISLAIYKEKYSLVALLLIFDNDSIIDELIRLLFFIIKEVKLDKDKTTILGYLRIYTHILSYIEPEYLNQRYNGKYLLVQLIELDNLDYFNKFIEKGNIDIEVKYKGMTPIMWAIIYQKSYYVKHLLELGANIFEIANTEIVNTNLPYKHKYDYHILEDIQLPFKSPRFPAPRNLNSIDIAEKLYTHLTEYNCIKGEKDEIFAILNLLGISYQLPNYECGICYREYLSNEYKFPSCSHSCCYDCATQLQKEYINEDSIDIIDNLFDYELLIECPFCREKSILSEHPLHIILYICDLNGNHTGKTLEVIPCMTRLKDIVTMIQQDDTPFTLSGIRYYVMTPDYININNSIRIYNGKQNPFLNSYLSDIGITNGTSILVSTEMHKYSKQIKSS